MKIIFDKYKGLVTLVTKRTIASFELKCRECSDHVVTAHCESLPTLKI
jgi:hypothetical protein